MKKTEFALILNAMLACTFLILGSIDQGWWKLYDVIATVAFYFAARGCYRELWPPEPRKGFWSKVWKR